MADCQLGGFTFHADRRQLLRGEKEVHLAPKACDLLLLLIGRAPAVVSKAEIHRHLWPDTFVSDATLVGVVKELRRALNDDHSGALIRTAHRVGYALASPLLSNTAGQSVPGAVCWLDTGTQHLSLNHGVNVVGRAPEAHVRLDAAGVSRRHACITVGNGSASIEDLGSKNGTTVAGKPVDHLVPLQDRDEIRVAAVVLVFRASDRGMSTLTESHGSSDLRGSDGRGSETLLGALRDLSGSSRSS